VPLNSACEPIALPGFIIVKFPPPDPIRTPLNPVLPVVAAVPSATLPKSNVPFGAGIAVTAVGWNEGWREFFTCSCERFIPKICLTDSIEFDIDSIEFDTKDPEACAPEIVKVKSKIPMIVEVMIVRKRNTALARDRRDSFINILLVNYSIMKN
jgi:hypothetical protein